MRNFVYRVLSRAHAVRERHERSEYCERRSRAAISYIKPVSICAFLSAEIATLVSLTRNDNKLPFTRNKKCKIKNSE